MNILSEPIVNYIINLYNIHYRIVISYLLIFLTDSQFNQNHAALVYMLFISVLHIIN